MPLSDPTIRNLKARGKACKVADFGGLFLNVRHTGSRLGHFKYRIGGHEKLLSHGIQAAVILAQARGTRDEARAMLANGHDTGAAKQERKRQDQDHLGYSFEGTVRPFVQKAVKEGATAPRILSHNVSRLTS
ncbi:MAG: Arm DNA-binding domain-containing protein [Albidovulum sp.]